MAIGRIVLNYQGLPAIVHGVNLETYCRNPQALRESPRIP